MAVGWLKSAANAQQPNASGNKHTRRADNLSATDRASVDLAIAAISGRRRPSNRRLGYIEQRVHDRDPRQELLWPVTGCRSHEIAHFKLPLRRMVVRFGSWRCSRRHRGN
jgi:hypothetical protein